MRTLEEVVDVRSAEAADKAQQLEQAQQQLTEAAAQYSELQVPRLYLPGLQCALSGAWVWRISM